MRFRVQLAFVPLFMVLLLTATQCFSQPAATDAGAEAAVDTLALPESNEGLPGAGPIRRADWFQDLWRERRGKWAEQLEADQGALVFLGDSITQGWGDRLEQEFAGIKTANRGISGDTTRGMLIRLDDDVLSLDPSGVVLLMGTNDLAERATPEVIASNIVQIIERLLEYNPSMPIVYCKVMPSSPSKQRPADKIREINRLVVEAVGDNKQVTVLDTYTLFADDQGNAKPEEFPDLLHPNEAGYDKWAEALRAVLAKLGFSVQEAAASTP